MHEAEKRQDFDRLVRENRRGLVAFAYTLTRNLSDSEDLVQECIATLWKKFDDFETGSNFGAWARTTVLYLAKNLARKRSRERLIFDSETLERIAVVHNKTDPGAERIRAFLRDCLGELGEGEREMILSRYEPGMDVSTLAERDGRNVKSAYNALARIRKGLLACMRRKMNRPSLL